MKRIIWLLLVVCLSLSLLVACQTGSAPTTEAPTTPPATTPEPTTPPVTTPEPTTPAPTTPPVTDSPTTEPPVYTVSFTGNGVSKTTHPAQRVQAGQYATQPKNPYYEGGDFTEWLLDGEPFDFATTPITGNITLEAGYALYEYTIRFFGDDGVQIGESQFLHFGDTAVVPDAPDLSAAGKEFSCWTNKAGTRNLDPTQPVANHQDYYAHYVVYHFVTFQLEDGTIVAENMKVLDGMCAIPPAYVVGEGDDAVAYYFAPSTVDEWKVTKDSVFTVAPMMVTLVDSYVNAASGNLLSNGGSGGGGAYILTKSVGHYIEYTTDERAVGPFNAYLGMVENTPEDFRVTLEVEVDGVVVNRLSFGITDGNKYRTLAILPKGRHTVKWTIVEAEGGVEMDGWLGVLCTAISYKQDVSDVTFDVAFKDHEGNVIDSKNVKYGETVTPPEVSAKLEDGRTFENWYDEDGVAFNPAAPVTANATYTATYKDLCTVTYVDGEGSTIATVKVLVGGTAALPKSDTCYYSVVGELSQICNVTEDKTVTLTAVPKANYVTTKTEVTLTTGLTEETKTKYAVTNDGSSKSWGCIFWKAGQVISFTADCAGTFSLRYAVDKTERQFVLNIMVDGVLYTTHTIDTSAATITSAYFTICDLPAGTHTVEVVVASVSGSGLASYSGLNIVNMSFFDAVPATEE